MLLMLLNLDPFAKLVLCYYLVAIFSSFIPTQIFRTVAIIRSVSYPAMGFELELLRKIPRSAAKTDLPAGFRHFK